MSDLQVTLALEGLYQFTIRRADGSIREQTHWMKNLILNDGLNRIGAGGIGLFCRVGSGSTAPSVTDGGLQTVVASTSTVISDTQGVQPTTPPTLPAYRWLRRTYRFGEGVAAGNLSEVGIGWDTGMFSRALILDPGGNPTTITVLSNEFLDVTYEARCYYPQTDSTFNLNLGPSTHTVTRRASSVTTAPPFSASLFFGNGMRASSLPYDNSQVFDGDISTVDARPSGLSDNISEGATNAIAYVNNSLKSVWAVRGDLNVWNFTNRIRSLVFPTPMGAFQFQFEPRIAKDNTYRLNLNIAVSWARKT